MASTQIRNYETRSLANNLKSKNQELSSLFMTHRINATHALKNGPDTVYYMELSQGEIIQKPKMQELSSLFMTHRLIVMYAPVKFHEYIP